MSDFDTVLERLLLDPQFKSALAREPARTLAGYQLSDEQRQILHAQMSAGAGGAQAQVEDRISKSSMFGLVSSLSSGFGNVAEYEEISHGGGDGDTVAFKEVDPMPVPHEADSPGAGSPGGVVSPEGDSPRGGPSPHMTVDPTAQAGPSPHMAVDPTAQAGPSPHMAVDPTAQAGPSPHMAVDPTAAHSGGDEPTVGGTEATMSSTDLKMAPGDLRVPISPDLPSR